MDNKRHLLLVLSYNYETDPAPFPGRLSVLELGSSLPLGTCVCAESVALGTPKEHEIAVDEHSGDVYVAVLGPPTTVMRLIADSTHT